MFLNIFNRNINGTEYRIPRNTCLRINYTRVIRIAQDTQIV